MSKEEPWWVCVLCQQKILRAGQGAGLTEAKTQHKITHCPGASYRIETRRG